MLNQLWQNPLDLGGFAKVSTILFHFIPTMYVRDKWGRGFITETEKAQSQENAQITLRVPL